MVINSGEGSEGKKRGFTCNDARVRARAREERIGMERGKFTSEINATPSEVEKTTSEGDLATGHKKTVPQQVGHSSKKQL